jgi:ankyrin repeat protein
MKTPFYFLILLITLISACQNSNAKLIESVNNMDTELFTEAINNKADLNLIVDSIPILHYAIWFSKIEMAELLIESGANLNTLNKYSLTAIDLAVDLNNLRLIKGLIENGAELNNDRINSSKIIDRSRSLEVFQLLESNGIEPDLTTLTSAIENDRDSICSYLIFEKNFSIYNNDINGIPAIMAVKIFDATKCQELVLKKDSLLKKWEEEEHKRDIQI